MVKKMISLATIGLSMCMMASWGNAQDLHFYLKVAEFCDEQAVMLFEKENSDSPLLKSLKSAKTIVDQRINVGENRRIDEEFRFGSFVFEVLGYFGKQKKGFIPLQLTFTPSEYHKHGVATGAGGSKDGLCPIDEDTLLGSYVCYVESKRNKAFAVYFKVAPEFKNDDFRNLKPFMATLLNLQEIPICYESAHSQMVTRDYRVTLKKADGTIVIVERVSAYAGAAHENWPGTIPISFLEAKPTIEIGKTYIFPSALYELHQVKE